MVILIALSGCNNSGTYDTATKDAALSKVPSDGTKDFDGDRKLAEAKILFAKCKAKGISTLKGDERRACNAASDTAFFQPYKSSAK